MRYSNLHVQEDKGTPVQLAPDVVLHSQNWDRLTMFRVDEEGTLELISMPAHRVKDRMFLEDSVDERAFGSLLISPDGAIGMVQAERIRNDIEDEMVTLSGFPLCNSVSSVV